MEVVSNPAVEIFEISSNFCCQKVYIELGKTSLTNATGYDLLFFYFFQEPRCLQLALKQMSEKCLHESLGLFLYFGIRARLRRVSIAAALEMS